MGRECLGGRWWVQVEKEWWKLVSSKLGVGTVLQLRRDDGSSCERIVEGGKGCRRQPKWILFGPERCASGRVTRVTGANRPASVCNRCESSRWVCRGTMAEGELR